jgi:hypothetical protein
MTRLSLSRLRLLPPVCALVAVLQGLVGRLGFERRYVGRELVMEDGRRFRVFRHLTLEGSSPRLPGPPTVFVVRFRFARLSQGLNRLLSLIPVPLIAGYTGFRQKVWMADEENDHWQGVYEWESAEAVEAYRRSFVLRLMNRRAEPESISYAVIEGTRLADFVDQCTGGPLLSPRRRGVVVDAEEAAQRRSPGRGK